MRPTILPPRLTVPNPLPPGASPPVRQGSSSLSTKDSASAAARARAGNREQRCRKCWQRWARHKVSRVGLLRVLRGASPAEWHRMHGGSAAMRGLISNAPPSAGIKTIMRAGSRCHRRPHLQGPNRVARPQLGCGPAATTAIYVAPPTATSRRARLRWPLSLKAGGGSERRRRVQCRLSIIVNGHQDIRYVRISPQLTRPVRCQNRSR
jgi:hypothetical protein